MTTTDSIRANLQAQGFCGLSDAACAQFNYPLRLAPAICMIWAAIGTAKASPTLLATLAPFAAWGAITRGHPFDVFYNHGIRHLTKTPPIPPYGFRRRFACGMATVMLLAAAWAFHAGNPLLGSVLGWFIVAATFSNVIAGFCLASLIVSLFAGKVQCPPATS